MPCYDERNYLGDNLHYHRKINKLTRLLCEANNQLNKTDLKQNMSDEFNAWAKDHEEKDNIRAYNEEIIKSRKKNRR